MNAGEQTLKKRASTERASTERALKERASKKRTSTEPTLTKQVVLTDELAVKRLSELGHGTRLAIFRLLVKANPEGLTVGDIQSHLDIPGSTLSHHISRLVSAGLVKQIREGRILRCVAQMESLDELMAYLTAECCSLE